MSTPIRKSRTRAAVFGVLAVVIAGSTAYAAYAIMSQYEQRIVDVREDSANQTVVVATRSLRPGTIVGPDDVALEQRPVGQDLGSYFTSIDGIIGNTVGDRVLEGEPLRMERMLAGGAQMGLDELIDPGARAVAIRTTRTSGVGGLLKPGQYVDVIVTIRPDDRSLEANWVTETIIQGAKVVAVNEVTEAAPTTQDPDEKKKRPAREFFISIEVSPSETEEVALAEARGEIHLALRAQNDFELVETDGPLVTNALIGVPEKRKVAAKERLVAKARRPTLRMQPKPTPVPDPVAAHQMDVVRGQAVEVKEYDADGQLIPSTTKRPR